MRTLVGWGLFLVMTPCPDRILAAQGPAGGPGTGRAFKRVSAGAFDVAVERLMRVWGFHRRRATAPTATELAEAREAVRAAVVELDGDVARLPSAHTQLDFGATGVGYGIDRRWRCSARAGSDAPSST